MKILLVGNVGPGSSEWSSENDYRQTLLGMGHDLTLLPEADHSQCGSYQLIRERADGADLVVWVSTPGRANPEMARAFGDSDTPVMGFHLDLYRGLQREKLDVVRPFFQVADIVFTADGGVDPSWWAERGVNHRWMPPGVLETSCYLAEPDPATYPYDVAFVGSRGYHQEHAWRGQLVSTLERAYGKKFGLFEHGFQLRRDLNDHRITNKMRGSNCNSLYATAKVAVGDSCFAGRPGYDRYTSDRLFEAGGRGALQVYPAIPGITDGPDALMVDGEHILTFQPESETSMLEAIERALAMSDEDRMAMRVRSIHHVRENHTYRHRFESMVSIMVEEGYLPAEVL